MADSTVLGLDPVYSTQTMWESTMADLEKCVEELRKRGYKASLGETPWFGPKKDLFETGQTKLIVRCRGFNVDFDELHGIEINKCNHVELFGKKRFKISYGFDEQSFFFQMKDEDLIDRVVRYVAEASEIMASLPIGFRPTDR